ncbi:MAG TPA: thioredoxin-disulfide reductase, partial [Dehalococcoidia bacterium]|nr:thioredoxin-disulfide reductase [Dehalococcoidia bacterium]
MAEQNTHYDVLIIGQGASSYSAAMYVARYQMKPIIFGAIFGGETATGGIIENYPGYPEIDGFELMLKFREQAEKYNVPIVDGNIVKAAKLVDGFEVTTEEGETYRGASIILGVGRERRTLGLDHETEWMGRGVSYCATCDAPIHRGNT